MSGGGTLTGWEYQQLKVGGSWGSWQAISSTDTSLSHTVSNLTNGSNYQFKVRAKNATGAGAASDASTAKAPADRSLTASSVEATTATIAIAGHATAWHYKANVGPDDSCTGPVDAGTSEKDLTGLSSNTSYTYEAYSDSTCTTANKLATASAFLTKPGKASTPGVATNVGTGGLKITSSVTGSGTLKKWQYSFKTDGSHGAWQDVSSTSTSLSHIVTGLTNSTDHRFKVRAVNATGNGATSEESSPGQPTQPSMSAGSVEAATATLTIANFTPDWYYKYTAPTGGTCSTSAVTGSFTKDLTDLKGNTSYTFKAYSDSSCSTEQAAASAFLTKPGKPSKPAVVGAGTGKLTITSSVTGAGAISEWAYQQKHGSNNYGSWTVINSTSKSLSHTVTGLTDGDDYKFKVRAKNATGDGVASDESDTAQPVDKSLTPSKIKATTVTLTIGGHTGNWYYKANTGPHTSCSTAVTGSSSVDLTGLSSNTTYTYTAYSDSGCSTAVVATSPFPTLPGKPTQPVAGGDGTGKLRLTASVTGSAALTKWEYQQKEGNNAWGSWTEISSTSTALNKVISGLTDGNSYRYKVRAVNGSGTGADSEASAVAKPAAREFTVTDITATTAKLTVAGHGGAWSYQFSTGPCVNVSAGTAEVVVEDLTSGVPHSVTAYQSADCPKTLGVSIGTARFPTPLAKVQDVGVSVDGGTVTVTWEAQAGVDGYYVQWKSGSEDWSETRQTVVYAPNNSAKITTSARTQANAAQANPQYTVRVRSFKNVVGDPDPQLGEWSETQSMTLTATSVTANSATLTIGGHSDPWWYEANVGPDATTCKGPVSGTKRSLSGLSPSTDYVYKVYDKVGCTGSVIATVRFTTESGGTSGDDGDNGGGTGGGGGGGGGGGSSAEVRIWATEPAVEGQPVRFRIQLGEPTRRRIDLLASTSSRTALDPADYKGFQNRAVTVNEGESVVWLEVPTVRDAEVEDDETFVVGLSVAVGSAPATVVRPTALGTIVNGPAAGRGRAAVPVEQPGGAARLPARAGPQRRGRPR